VLVSGIHVPDMEAAEASVSAKLRFNAVRFTDAKEGPALFAELCDQVRALAESLAIPRGFREGPFLGLADTEPVERAAVALAVENAYPVAEAAADVMGAQIDSVLSVKVLDVTWNKDETWRAPLPDLKFTTCTARVHVTYTFIAVASR